MMSFSRILLWYEYFEYKQVVACSSWLPTSRGSNGEQMSELLHKIQFTFYPYSDLIELNRVHQLLCIEKFTLLPHEHHSFLHFVWGERIAYNHISNQNMSLSLLLLWCRLLLRRHRVSKGSSNGNGRSDDSVAFHRLNKDDGRNHNDDNTLGSVENR